MPLDCLQIKILAKQPRWPYFFVLDTTEHIICKNGELGIFCNIDMSERVLYEGKKILGPGWKSAMLVFLSQVLQNYFRVFLLALTFEIMQDMCRRPVNDSFVEI